VSLASSLLFFYACSQAARVSYGASAQYDQFFSNRAVMDLVSILPVIHR
jgi:hypothetical protein